MSQVDRRKVEEIFQELMDVPRAERAGAMEKLCAGDGHVRRAVERLLKAHEASEDFLEAPALVTQGATWEGAAGSTRVDVGAEALPERVGPYEIVRVVGQGGMGVVYEARQQSPSRVVALKVISPGQGSSGMARRFQREADLLGQVQHPGIACVYEAGSGLVTGAGWSVVQPYIAMEFVRGETITRYCAARDLGVRERVELVAKVADAVQHAHERGIIHRDLKPGNILVDDSGQPKVLDFGVARLTESDVRTVTMQTAVGQIIGTLDYMSPEQVEGDPAKLDARSDLYSLGVILFELLTGRLPHELRGLPLAEAIRVLKEEEPSRLSGSSGVGAKSTRRFDRDIETIVTKALEKDRARRYSSAAALAVDLRRYVQDEPIVARRASAWYRLRKFAKRNKVLVAGVAMLVVALVVVSLVAQRAIVQRGIARREQARAERQAYRTSMAAAWAAIQNHDGAGAIGYLDEAPTGLRRWEWDLLHRMADPRIGSVPTLAKPEVWDYSNAEVTGIACRIDREAGRAEFAKVDGGEVVAGWEVPRGASAGVRPLKDGQRCLAWVNDARLEMRELRTGRVLWTNTEARPDSSVNSSPDDSLIAASSFKSKLVWVIEASSGRTVRAVHAECDLPAPVFSPDNALMGAGDQVFEVATGRALWASQGTVQSFSPDSALVAVSRAGPEGRRMCVLEARTGVVRGSFPTSSAFTWATPGAIFSEDSRTVYAIESPGFLVARDVATFSPLSSAIVRPGAGLTTPEGGQVILMPDRHSVAAAINYFAGSPIFDGVNLGVAFTTPAWHGSSFDADVSADGALVARGMWGRVSVEDARTGRMVWYRARGLFQMRSVRFSPDGTKVACDAGLGRVQVLDALDGRVVKEFPAVDGAGTYTTHFRWAGNGTLIAGRSSGRVLAWTMEEEGAGVREVGRVDGAPSALAVDAAGKRLAVVRERTLIVMDLASGREVRRVALGGAALAAAFSPSGRTLALGVQGGVDELDTQTWMARAGRRGASTAVRALGWDRAGERLWGASQDSKLLLWDESVSEAGGEPPAVRQEIAAIPTGNLVALCVGFAGDGKGVVLACSGGTITWDIARPSEALARERSRWSRAGNVVRASLAGAAGLGGAASLDELERRIREDSRVGSGRGTAQAARAAEGDLADALALARTVGVYGPRLNSDAWAICTRTSDSAENYARGLAYARGAAEADPDDWRILNTLALSAYRAKSFEEAKRAAEEAEGLATKEGSGAQASNWAILAMARAALGEAEGAREALTRAAGLIGGAKPREFDAAIVGEARGVVEKMAPGPEGR